MNTDTETDTERPVPTFGDTATRFLRARRADAARAGAGLRARLREVDWTEVRYLAGGLLPVAAVIGVLALLVLFVTAMTGALRSIDVPALWQKITDLTAVRMVTDPISGYLTQHALGLPIAPHTLGTVWAVTCGVLLLLAWSGSRGARIGWVLTGIASVAMAYAGVPALNAPIAAGATALAWMAGSVLAFTRHRIAVPQLLQHAPRPSLQPRPTPAAPAPADQLDLVQQAHGRAEQLLFHASLSQTDSERSRWTRASRSAVDLIGLIRTGHYRSDYVHTVLDVLNPERYLTAPTHTDIDTARIYLALAETAH